MSRCEGSSLYFHFFGVGKGCFLKGTLPGKNRAGKKVRKSTGDGGHGGNYWGSGMEYSQVNSSYHEIDMKIWGPKVGYPQYFHDLKLQITLSKSTDDMGCTAML